MASTTSLLDGFRTRRSHHKLTSESTIPDSRIQELVQEVVLHSPSAWNAQTARLVVLLGEEHKKLWDIARDTAKATVPSDLFEKLYRPRCEMFHAAYGTVLFYEDPEPLRELEAKWPMLKDKFPEWANHSNGMHQYALWTVLEAEGLGCNLQHYNPMIDARVAEEWNIPVEWSLKAQMVFGKPAGTPHEKTFEPIEKRVFVHGAAA